MSLPIIDVPKFRVNYTKRAAINVNDLEKSSQLTSVEDNDANYNPFHIKAVQNYNPIYSVWFQLDASNYNGITLNNKYNLLDMNTVYELSNATNLTRPVFIKYSPLLDPIRYMVGKYETSKDILRNLPTLASENIYPKIQDRHNMAYVDYFFSYLSSQLLHTHNCLHGIDYYGSFTGIQEQFKQDITDDYEYLQSSSYFKKNLNILFKTSYVDPGGYINYGSRGNKPRLQLHDVSLHNITASTIDILETDNNEDQTDTELVYTNDLVEPHNESSTSSDDSNSSDTTSTSGSHSDDESDWETDEDSLDDSINSCDDDDDDDDDSCISETTCFAYIQNFPVQCIALQKCDGTLDSLLENHHLGTQQCISALMQIVMTLLCYQTSFLFTHNDLHTNNIMYTTTTDEFLYYTYKRIVYKVPTYGKIFKIIDFGRAIYNYNGIRFCSDSFAPSGDASTQYNCEPYMDENKPRLDPNLSFDLCRLGCSLYDFLIDDDDAPANYDELQSLVYDWCLDDNKKNVLYKQNGDERYPNFKLYKMIARTVHNKTPADQLSRKIFKQFVVASSIEIPVLLHVNIDLLPDYYTKYM